MASFRRWKNGTAAFLAIAISTGTITPLFSLNRANAQVIFGEPRRVSISAGATLPVTYEKDKIVVAPDETLDLTLKVASDIVDRSGNLLIPKNTEIKGELRPASDRDSDKGSQFVAEELIFPNGDRQSIDAASDVVTNIEKIKKGSDSSKVLQDAAIGAGAAAVIELLTGDRDIDILGPVAGAGAGALASVLLRKKTVEVVVINPEKDLDVTLDSDLVISLSRN